MGWFSRKPNRLVLPLGEVTFTHSFDDGRHVGVGSMRPGQHVELEFRRQPDNATDHYAVQMHTEHGPVAYFSHEDAVRYARVLDRIQRLLWVQGMHTGGDDSPVQVSLPSTRAAKAWLKQQRVVK